MVSDLDTLVTKNTKPEPPPVLTSSERTEPDHQSIKELEPRLDSQQQARRSVSRNSSKIKLLLGIGVVIGVIWILYETGNQSIRPAPPSSSQSSETLISGQNGIQQTLSQPKTPSRPSEETPPVGTNLILGSGQIRYCLAENIRLDSAQSGLNNTIESDAARFNEMVGDYNSRCAEYRYRRGSLESARSEVERYRSLLESEGRSRFTQILSVGPRRDPIKNSKVKGLDSSDSSMGGLKGPREIVADVPNLSSHASQKRSTEASSDHANFRVCIDGKTPSLCNHSILMPSEAIRVDRAERRANFETCSDGRYPALCNHSLLTTTQTLRVDASEKEANLKTCIDGRYSPLCNHSLLTEDQFALVKQAEQEANLEECIDGKYPALCDHSLLTSDQAALVRNIELRTGREN